MKIPASRRLQVATGSAGCRTVKGIFPSFWDGTLQDGQGAKGGEGRDSNHPAFWQEDEEGVPGLRYFLEHLVNRAMSEFFQGEGLFGHLFLLGNHPAPIIS